MCMNLEQDKASESVCTDGAPEKSLLSLSLATPPCCSNEEQSLVTVTNQSQLWKQTSSWPLISLPHLLLLCLSSTSSVPLLSPYLLLARPPVFPLLWESFSFVSPIHLSCTPHFREHWWCAYSTVMMANRGEASRPHGPLKKSREEANSSRPTAPGQLATMSTRAVQKHTHKLTSHTQLCHSLTDLSLFFLYVCVCVCTMWLQVQAHASWSAHIIPFMFIYAFMKNHPPFPSWGITSKAGRIACNNILYSSMWKRTRYSVFTSLLVLFPHAD